MNREQPAAEILSGTEPQRIAKQIAKRIPYGSAEFGRMRYDNSYYVDKTRFIPLLEAQPYFVFLIRPRRFGKTLWLSLLQHYYDVNRADEFDALFAGTYIGDHPTAERNSYRSCFSTLPSSTRMCSGWKHRLKTMVKSKSVVCAAINDFLQKKSGRMF